MRLLNWTHDRVVHSWRVEGIDVLSRPAPHILTTLFDGTPSLARES
jgi:hypothetical protein